MHCKCCQYAAKIYFWKQVVWLSAHSEPCWQTNKPLSSTAAHWLFSDFRTIPWKFRRWLHQISTSGNHNHVFSMFKVTSSSFVSSELWHLHHVSMPESIELLQLSTECILARCYTLGKRAATHLLLTVHDSHQPFTLKHTMIQKASYPIYGLHSLQVFTCLSLNSFLQLIGCRSDSISQRWYFLCILMLYILCWESEEVAAPPCLLWDGLKQWVLSPENRQPYSLGYSCVQRDG